MAANKARSSALARVRAKYGSYAALMKTTDEAGGEVFVPAHNQENGKACEVEEKDERSMGWE